MNALDLLIQRGYIQQSTDADALREHLAAGPVTFYIGFDPTADSLHIGHMLQLMLMAWLQRLGHRPIVVHGGGTAMVGDPTGKDKTREFLDEDRIRANLAGQRKVFDRFLDLAPEGAAPTGNQAVLENNADWLCKLNYVAFLRDIGQHFSVNRMIASESARLRLERNQGLSFIEFNYHLLQSYDFLWLYRKHGCTLELGGDDQWFNILGGADLIRREEGAVVHCATTPLMVTADGKKMGKTEAGAVWVDGDKLAPYDYYQFWVNVDDRDVGRFLRLYTFLDLARIEELERLDGADIREAKRVLAWEATALAHGAAEADRAAEAAAAAFSGGVSADMPTFPTAFPRPIVELLADSGLVQSRSAARRLIAQGGVRVGDARVTDVDAVLDGESVLWAGKKKAVRVVGL